VRGKRYHYVQTVETVVRRAYSSDRDYTEIDPEKYTK